MLDEPRRRVLQVVADDGLGRLGPACLDSLDERAVLAGQLTHRSVALDQLRQAEKDLDLEILVSPSQTGVSGSNDQGAVKAQIGLHDDALRRARAEAVVLRGTQPRSASMRAACTSSAVRSS